MKIGLCGLVSILFLSVVTKRSMQTRKRLVLSVATSIDALAVGVALSLITSSIFIAVTIIGIVTFTLSYLGVFIGKKVGHFFENKIEALGGLVLTALGVKILFEHLLI